MMNFGGLDKEKTIGKLMGGQEMQWDAKHLGVPMASHEPPACFPLGMKALLIHCEPIIISK